LSTESDNFDDGEKYDCLRHPPLRDVHGSIFLTQPNPPNFPTRPSASVSIIGLQGAV